MGGFAAVALLLTSCTDVALLKQDTEIKSNTITINATSSKDTVYEYESRVINFQEELDKEGITSESIKDIAVKSVRMVLVSPETGNFDWGKDLDIRMQIMDQLDPTKVQLDLELGIIRDLENGLTEITIPVAVKGLQDNQTLREVLLQQQFRFMVTGTTDDIIPVDHQVDIFATLGLSL